MPSKFIDLEYGSGPSVPGIGRDYVRDIGRGGDFVRGFWAWATVRSGGGVISVGMADMGMMAMTIGVMDMGMIAKGAIIEVLGNCLVLHFSFRMIVVWRGLFL
jgi:hypothetical protein